MSRIKPKSYAMHPHRCQDHGMEFGHYYVVEISFRPSNPVHRYIAHGARGGERDVGVIEIAGDGIDWDDRYVRLDQVAFFRVIEEIHSMRAAPSRHMPPAFDAELAARGLSS